jgi:methyl-accepting chemotaxis protein
MRLHRKQYFVNSRLQWTLILGANVLAFVGLALIVTLMLYAQTHLENYATGLNLAPNHPALQFLAQREAEFDRLCIGIAVVLIALFNALGIVLSHRIAGPLYRLQRHLEAVGAGKDPADVHFRKGDLYQQLAEACNKVMARLREARAKQRVGA